MKLRDYHDGYYVHEVANLAPSTLNGYESGYRVHIEPVWADWEMEEIRPRDINAWLATYGKPGAAEKAYKMLRQILHAAMADECYDDGVVDPTTRAIRLPKKPSEDEHDRLTPKQSRELLLAIVGWEYEATVICGVWLGLRRSEQCGLKWGDVDLKTGKVRIRRGLHYIKGEVVVADVKTNRSRRDHMLPRTAVMRLREIKYEARAKADDWLLGGDPNPERYARRFRAYCKKTGCPWVAPKFFRHSFKDAHSAAGTPDGDVQKMLGHVHFATSYQYMRLDDDVLRARQKALEKVVLRA